MGLSIARVGDPIAHGTDVTGEITTGSPDVTLDYLPIARLGDQAYCNREGHGTVTIVTASEECYADHIAVAREGDQLSCGAVILRGSPDGDSA